MICWAAGSIRRSSHWQQPTVLLSIYQNNTWTIRRLVDETIDPVYYMEDCQIYSHWSFLSTHFCDLAHVMLQNHSSSVYILGIVHVCLGICLLAASTNKTKKSLLSQNKLPLNMSKKLYLPHPSSACRVQCCLPRLPRLLCHSLVPPAKNCQLN